MPSDKPTDFVRCHRCGRLCEKDTATEFGGVTYGPDCLLLAVGAHDSDTSASTAELLGQKDP